MVLEHRVKPHIAAITPYEPGKPVEELERELGISEAVKLASNENPLGPSPKAVVAMREAAAAVNRYPEGSAFGLRRKLAERLDVEPGQLVFGSGSSEILELVAKAFLGPGDEAVYAWPSFALYPLVAQGMGARAVPVPLDAGFVHDLPAMAKAVGERTRVVIVCNPNNPSGTSVGREELDRFVDALPADVVLVIDEAYGEYARRSDFPDGLAVLARRPATLVMRTFSKIHGLAGARVGYGVTGLELAGYLERARRPFNLNGLAEAGALAALDDHEHVERTLAVTREGADWLRGELAGLGIESVPTDANFLLVRIGEGGFERLLREGVIVRPMAGFGLPDHVRITIGTAEENARLIEALRQVLDAGTARKGAAGAAEARP